MFLAMTPPFDSSKNRSPQCSAKKQRCSSLPARWATSSACAFTARPATIFSANLTATSFATNKAQYAQFFGIAAQPVEGDHGVLQVEQLMDRIHPENDHYTRTRLVTASKIPTTAAPVASNRTIRSQKFAAGPPRTDLARHLDGARLFNAVVATGITAADWASHFDTVSVCFSKGLGAPIGSALCGPADLIRQARRHRKALGGGWRQAGIIAAGALYALDHNIDRLAEDHANARIIAEAVRSSPGLRLDPEIIDTNIVIFELDPELGTAASFVARLRDEGVWMNVTAPQRIRAVTHLDVSREQVQHAAAVLQETAVEVQSVAANADQYLPMALLPQIRLRSFFFMFFCAAVGLTCATSPQVEDPLLTSRGIYVPHLNIHYGLLVAASTAVIVGLVRQARFIAKSHSAESASPDLKFGQWCAIYWRLAIALVVFCCLIVRLLVSRQILPEAQHDYYPEHVFPEAIVLTSIIIVLTASVSRFSERTARQKRSFVIRILVPMLAGIALLLVALANMGFMPSLLHIATHSIEMNGQLRFRRPGAFPDQAANGFRLFWLSLGTLVAIILAAVGLACVVTAELTRSARLALMTILRIAPHGIRNILRLVLQVRVPATFA